MQHILKHSKKSPDGWLEKSQSKIDGGELVGRDPRKISADAWRGNSLQTVRQAVRAKCIDCCGGSATEVRKCVAIDCSLWAFRMGVEPQLRRAMRTSLKGCKGGN